MKKGNKVNGVINKQKVMLMAIGEGDNNISNGESINRGENNVIGGGD